MKKKRSQDDSIRRLRNNFRRQLSLEYLELRQLMASDVGDTFLTATDLASINTTPTTISSDIGVDTDVDMYQFSVAAGQTVDFDIDTAQNGTGGLGSFIRIFNSKGQQLSFNNDAIAPGEDVVGFDAYLRYTFANSGTYFIGVSNANNTLYDPITSNGDTNGGPNATGVYQLIIQALPDDPDDTMADAKVLSPITATPTIVESAIAPDIDVDLYRFQASSGQTVDFDIDTALNGPGGLGSFIRLFNAQGQQLDFNNDAAAPGENQVGFDSYLRYTFASDGVFYLGVSNFTNTQYDPMTGNGDSAGGPYSIGAYTLSIQTVAPPPVDLDDSIGEAIVLGTITTSESVTGGRIDFDTDVNLYRFSVSAGQVVDFDIDTPFNGPGGLGSNIRLFSSRSVQLASNNDAAAPGENVVGFDSYLRYTFSTAGTYFLGVSNFTNVLYDPVTGNGDMSGGPFATGNYQLVIHALADDADDSLVEANSVGVVSSSAITVNGNIVEDIDVDMYRFTVDAGQVVNFDIDTPLNGPGGLGSYLRIFNSAGQQIDFNDDGTAPGEGTLGFDSFIQHQFTLAGTYYVAVSNYNNTQFNPVNGNADTAGGLYSIGTYKLIVQSPAPTPPDSDDSLSEATVLGSITTAPSSVSDAITPDTDVDMYRFEATAGQTIDFDIDTPLNGPGGLGSFLRLFNTSGQQLAFNNDGAAPGENQTGFDAYLRYTFTLAGTYFLSVSNANNTTFNPVTGNGDTTGGSNSTGSYQLIVQSLPVDFDDSLSEAVSLGAISTSPTTVGSNIATDIDVDMFRFTVNAGQVIDFDIDTPTNGPAGLGSYIRLFNDQGVQLAVNNDAAAPNENFVGFDSYLRFTFPVAGTFFLGVSNANNTQYNPLTGNGDTAGGNYSIGDYQLILQEVPTAFVDEDDSISEAIFLGEVSTTPISVSASINPDIDVNMYQFTATSNQTIDFDIDTVLNGPGGLGSYLRLFDSKGVELAFNNDAAAPGENTVGFDSYLRYTFATSDTYYIAVSNANNSQYDPVTGNRDSSGGANSTGNYTLTLQALPIDPDDTISEATSLGAISTTPVTVNGTINPDIDVDLYSFTVLTGQVIDFDVDTPLNGPGGLGSYLRLFNSDGQQLDFNDDAIAPGETQLGFDAYLRYTFAYAGTYYIGLSNFNNTQYSPITGRGDTAGGLHAIGTYQLTLQAVQVSAPDPDDSISEAVLLGTVSTTPLSINATITPDTDVDIFRISVTAGQVVDFDIDTLLNGSGGLGSYLRLFDAQGHQLAFNNDGYAPGEDKIGFDAYLRYTFTVSGSYFVGISNVNNTLYDPISGSGDFFGGSNSTGDYQLTVVALPTDSDDTLSEATSLGAISSTPIVTDSTISPDIDVDMYRFSVSAGQIVDFDIDTTLNGPGGLGSYLRVFDSSGQQIDFNDDGAAPGENIVGFDSYLRHTFNNAGTYYVAVSNYRNTQFDANNGTGDIAGGFYSIGNYRLIVQSFASPSLDPDDTISEATLLGAISTTPTVVNASITPDTDVNMVRFTVTSGQIVDFDIDTTFNGPGGLGSFVRLFDSSGQQIASNNDGTAPGENQTGYDAYLRYAFTVGGTYYLGVSNANNPLYDPISGNGDISGGENATGSYQLTIQALPNDADNTLSKATSIGAISTTPSIVSGSISPDIDVDMYRFTVAAGQVVDFDIDTPFNGPAGLGSFIRLFNDQGQQLAFNNDGVAPGESLLGFDSYLRFTFASAGTFFIGVSNFNNDQYNPNTGANATAGGFYSIGSYQLIVNAVDLSPNDPNDSIPEASFLGTVSTMPFTVNSSISFDTDVNLVSFSVAANTLVDFDIDTPQNGPGGLGSYLRLFDSQGQQIAFNNDAAAPGESQLGFDAYLRYAFTLAGTYYVGISNVNNAFYNPITGDGDTSGGSNSTGVYQLVIQALPVDTNDSLSEAVPLGPITTTPTVVTDSITPDIDVDLYQFTAAAGDVIDFDIDTALNGPGGLGSFIRLFNSSGQLIDFNNDAAAPGENRIGFDSYLRHTFTQAGTYYLGVSNQLNVQYDPTTGNGDTAGGSNSIGDYQLAVQAISTATPTLTLSINLSSIPEIGGIATGTVTRNSPGTSAALTVNLQSSDPTSAIVPASVVIPANQYSANFQITAVHNPGKGTTTVSISSSALGFTGDSRSFKVTDGDGIWCNVAKAADVNDDHFITPIDALLVINYLNLYGAGYVPEGSPPPYLDVNGDSIISPTDVLIVINTLNAQSSGEGESDAAATLTSPPQSNSLETLAPPLVDAYWNSRSRRNGQLVDEIFANYGA